MYLHALDALGQPQEKQPTDEELLCRRDMLLLERVISEATQDLAKCQAALKAAQRKTGPPKKSLRK